MSYLSLPDLSRTDSRDAGQPRPTRSLRSRLSLLPIAPTTPAADDCVELVTGRRGYFYDFDGRDPFTPQRHLILRCIRPPPTMLAVGSKVMVQGAPAELVRVFSVKKGRVRFVLGPYARFAPYVVLQVPQQYTELPWHWRAWLRLCRLGRSPREEVRDLES
jgi:hypothetical protein